MTKILSTIQNYSLNDGFWYSNEFLEQDTVATTPDIFHINDSSINKFLNSINAVCTLITCEQWPILLPKCLFPSPYRKRQL